MAGSVNEQLAEADVGHQVDLHQYANGVVRKLIALLNRTDADLAAQIAAALERMSASAFTVERLESLLASVRSLNAQAYAVLHKELEGELHDLVEYEAGYQLQLFRSVIPPQVVLAVGVDTVSIDQVYAAAMSRPFQGRLLKEWAASLETGRMARIRDAIRIGYVENQTIPQIVQRIRGTRAKSYADGFLETDRRHVEAVVRTAISHTANFARNKFYEANSDLISAVVWTSTLDARTSEPCRLRDGKRYDAETHKPIGHKLPWGGGPGAFHWCCRSVATPVTKSWRELGLDIEEFSPATRASMDGQVPADTTYGEWLKNQSTARQDEILGPERGALFRQGKLPLDRFANDRGKWLSLDELRERDAKAFERAGLDNPMRAPRGQPQDEIARFLASKPDQRELLDRLYAAEGDRLSDHMALVSKVKAEQEYRSTEESLAAVRYYTGSGYAEVNRRMRESGGTLEDRQFTALTASALPGMKPYHDEVWRSPTTRKANADKWWDKATVGEPMDIGNQLQSFSASANMAAQWAMKGDVLLRIAKPRGGAYIAPVSQHDTEKEVLLPPGQKYRVVGKSVKTVNGREMRVIDLEIE